MYDYDLRKRLSNYHIGGIRIKSVQITNSRQYLLTHSDILGRSWNLEIARSIHIPFSNDGLRIHFPHVLDLDLDLV